MANFDAVDGASILAAMVASLTAWAAQRRMAKASESNTNTTSRVEMEKEAYDRARAYDTETISRQDNEIKELREEATELRREVKVLREDKNKQDEVIRMLLDDKARQSEEVKLLRQRIARLERGISPDSQELIRERAEDLAPPISD